MKQGWEIKKLGEVCEKISRGISPKYIEENGVIVLNQKCVRDHKINFEPSRIHDAVTKNVSADKYIRIGDVLVNSTGEGTLGRVAQVRDLPQEKVTVDSHISIVRPLKDKFFLEFFGWAMVFIENEIENSGAGASGQTELARTVLENNFTLVYPKSLPEQQRIVAILDEAFAAIAKAKANAKQNLQNAKELFESYLQGVFENKGEGWEERSLGEIAIFRNGMNFTKSSKGEVIKIVGVRDFKNSFWIPFENLESVTLDGKLNEIDFLKEGDIIAVRSNGNPQLIGRTLLSGNLDGKISHSGFTIRVRLNSNVLLPIYLCNYLKTQKTREELVNSGNGVGIRSLNQGSLSSLIIPFPKSLKTQQTIVQKLDALSAETKKLEAIYQQKLTDLEELKKSILQKAFSGGLN